MSPSKSLLGPWRCERCGKIFESNRVPALICFLPLHNRSREVAEEMIRNGIPTELIPFAIAALDRLQQNENLCFCKDCRYGQQL